jgi:hypothetical protein
MVLRKAIGESCAWAGSLALRVLIAITLLTARPATSAGSDKIRYELNNLFPSPIIMLNPCAMNPIHSFCDGQGQVY